MTHTIGFDYCYSIVMHLRQVFQSNAKIYCVSLCFLFFVCLELPGEGEENKNQPCIKIDKLTYDFGKVEEGIKIKHTFKIANIGKQPLKIINAHATCGCTIPTLEKKELKSYESCRLHVIVDTSMKQKAITKTVLVSSNDPIHPAVNIQLSMFVLDPHRNMKGDVGVKIFKDTHCASCHVNRGVRAMGLRLYQADCAMCHGNWAQGTVGPALTGQYDNQEFAQSIKRVIAYGSKTHRSMPGFSVEAGGPLSNEQIDSLMEFLARTSKAKEYNDQRRNRKFMPDGNQQSPAAPIRAK